MATTAQGEIQQASTVLPLPAFPSKPAPKSIVERYPDLTGAHIVAPEAMGLWIKQLQTAVEQRDAAIVKSEAALAKRLDEADAALGKRIDALDARLKKLEN